MQSMTRPNLLSIEYPPTVTGTHLARTNRLNCEKPKASGEWSCTPLLSKEEVVFDEDPAKHFTLGPGTNLDEAIEIFNAYNDGRVQFSEKAKPWIKNLKVHEITRDGACFLIKTSDCGCNDGVKVQRRREGDAINIVAVASLAGMCI
jgi:hypothetical protein